MTTPTESKAAMMAQLVRKITTIPPLPHAVSQLCRLASDLDTDVQKIDRVIMSDQALTSRLLRVANSAFYGLTQRVTTVNQAVVIIGFQGVKNLALSVSVVGFQSSDTAGLPIPREVFWRHALAVASAARILAGPLHIRVPEEAFTAGLLHDIGQLLLMEQFPGPYTALLVQAARAGTSIQSLEEEAFGIHHGAVGRELCQHWRIPPVLTRVVAEHDLPPSGEAARDEDRILLAVQIANTLATLGQIGSDGDPLIDLGFQPLLARIGLSFEIVRQTIMKLHDEVKKMEAFLELPASASLAAAPPDRPDVCLRVGDAPTREIVGLILLGLGCPLMSEAALEAPRDRPGVVVTDTPLPAERAARLQGAGITSMDLARWKATETPAAEPGKINIAHLRAWLLQGLTPS